MKLAEQLKLSEVVRWERDPKTQAGNFVIASKDTGVEVKDVDELLRQYGTAIDNDIRAEHTALAASIVEPILQAVPYVRWTNQFYTQVAYGDLEDNRIPVEYYVTTAWESGPDAEALFVRPGFAWTRPSFHMYQTGIEMPWSVIAKSGWNILSRMMRRATEEIARKVDLAALSAMDVAIDALAGQGTVVAGGLMTKAGIDAVIKAANTAGFPMATMVVNSGTATDMAAWSGGPFYNAALPPETTRSILQTLYLGDYGGLRVLTNPFVPATLIYLGGDANAIGYEQVRGTGRTASDVDIRKGFDYHVIFSPEYAWYIGNSLNLRKLRIGA